MTTFRTHALRKKWLSALLVLSMFFPTLYPAIAIAEDGTSSSESAAQSGDSSESSASSEDGDSEENTDSTDTESRDSSAEDESTEEASQEDIAASEEEVETVEDLDTEADLDTSLEENTDNAEEENASEEENEETSSEESTEVRLDESATSTENSLEDEESEEATIESHTGTTTATTTTAIITGDATLIVDVENQVNTNLINSTGTIEIITDTTTGEGNLDLSDLFDGFGTGGGSGTSTATTTLDIDDVSATTTTTIENTNVATTTNDISLDAVTGENQITGSTSDAVIVTGTSTAIANVVNLVNTNIIDSEYLIFIANKVGDLVGDVILPSVEFFENLFASFGGGDPVGSENTTDIDTILNTNDALVENNLNLTTDTGRNTVGGSGEIVTGDATAASNVLNYVNTNLIGVESFKIVLRVLGNWMGGILNLPDTLYAEESENGVTITYRPRNTGTSTASVCCNNVYNERTIINDNQAVISNNIDLSASTGGNTIEGGGTIVTGAAQTLANVVNIANTNVIDSLWGLGVITILGNLNGNVSFGQTDLVITKESDAGSISHVGDEITYYIEVENRGPSIARNVRIVDTMTPQGLLIIVDDGGGILNGGSLVWNFAELLPGTTRTISYTVEVSDDIPLGQTDVTNTARVSASISDSDTSNNSDSETVTVDRSVGGIGGGEEDPDEEEPASEEEDDGPELRIIKTNNADGAVSPGDIVSYHVVIKNLSRERIFNAVLTDVLSDPNGDVVSNESWDLDTILPHEEIVFDYDVQFNESAIAGTYINRVVVRGESRDGEVISDRAASEVEVDYFGTGGGEGDFEDPEDEFWWELPNIETESDPTFLPGLPNTGNGAKTRDYTFEEMILMAILVSGFMFQSVVFIKERTTL